MVNDWLDLINPLSPVSLRCGSNFKSLISKHMLQIKFMSTSCEIGSHVNAIEHLQW